MRWRAELRPQPLPPPTMARELVVVELWLVVWETSLMVVGLGLEALLVVGFVLLSVDECVLVHWWRHSQLSTPAAALLAAVLVVMVLPLAPLAAVVLTMP